MNAPATLIRDFQPGDELAFRSLNEAWITRYFTLEPTDSASLNHPQSKILDRGGRILFAVQGGETVGCCALVPMATPNQYEVSKMTVAESARGTGAGRQLLAAIIDLARTLGATRLYLETNHILSPAIHLYKVLGFQPVPHDQVTPSPYARADVYMELYLEPNRPGTMIPDSRLNQSKL